MLRPNFTAIPNELLDDMLSTLSECELKVILFVLRKTSGYHRDGVTVSQARIGEWIGMDRATVCRACKRLVELDVLTVVKNAEDGICLASTYAPNFPEAPEESAVILKSQRSRESRAGGIAPESQHIEKRNTTERKELKTPVCPLANHTETPENFTDMLHRWTRHPGFKKPNKAQRTIGEEHWKSVEIGETLLAACMDVYQGSDWAKENGYPFLAFTKDPYKWLPPRSSEPEPILEAAEVVLPPSLDSGAPQVVSENLPPAVEKVNYPAKWNALVPASPVVWDAKRGAISNLRACEADPMFGERFEEMCKIAQKIHEARPGEFGWLGFTWCIKPERGTGVYGWFKLLNDLAWMAEKEKPKSSGKVDKHKLTMDLAEKIRRGEIRV